MQSREQPRIEVTLPVSSTVIAESFSDLTPTANGWHEFLQNEIDQATQKLVSLANGRYKVSNEIIHKKHQLPVKVLISDVYNGN